MAEADDVRHRGGGKAVPLGLFDPAEQVLVPQIGIELDQFGPGAQVCRNLGFPFAGHDLRDVPADVFRIGGDRPHHGGSFEPLRGSQVPEGFCFQKAAVIVPPGSRLFRLDHHVGNEPVHAGDDARGDGGMDRVGVGDIDRFESRKDGAVRENAFEVRHFLQSDQFIGTDRVKTHQQQFFSHFPPSSNSQSVIYYTKKRTAFLICSPFCFIRSTGSLPSADT